MNTFLRTREEGRSLTRARSSPWCHSSSYGPKLGRSASFGERTAIGLNAIEGTGSAWLVSVTRVTAWSDAAYIPEECEGFLDRSKM
jgi:hypothetical protein